MTLENYLHNYLGGLASQLGWSVESNSYAFIVSDTLLLYGVNTEEEATNTIKLYAIAKIKLWESVLREFSFDFDYSANGASFSRSQVYKQVKENLENAISEGYQYLPDYQITVGELITEKQDPYSNYPYLYREG